MNLHNTMRLYDKVGKKTGIRETVDNISSSTAYILFNVPDAQTGKLLNYMK